jgi:hypothetical protein
MDEPEAWGASRFANTAPTAISPTSPVADQGYYQPQMLPPHQMAPHYVPPFVPPKSRSPIGWILGFIGIAGFVVIILAVMFVARSGRRGGSEIRVGGSGRAEIAAPGEMALGASTADRVEATGSETVLIKMYNLSPDAEVNVRNVNGSITVTTWNQPRAEVRAIKKGSAEDGAQTFIKYDQGGNLSIRTGTGRRNNTDVRYELKLPQNIDRLQLETENGGIKVTDLTADRVSVETNNGTLDLMNVVGLSDAETNNGMARRGPVVVHDEREYFAPAQDGRKRRARCSIGARSYFSRRFDSDHSGKTDGEPASQGENRQGRADDQPQNG